MKRLFIVLFGVSCFLPVLGQKLTFDYDGAGNQRSRLWICVNCPPSAALSHSSRVNESSNIAKFSLSKDLKIQLDRSAQELVFGWDKKSPFEVDSIVMLKIDALKRFATIKSKPSSFLKIDTKELEEGTYLFYVYGSDRSRREIVLHKI